MPGLAAGCQLHRDTQTHQDRTLAIDAVTVTVLAERKQYVQALLAEAGVMLAPTAYVFTSDPGGLTPWNPDWLTHKVAEVAHGAGIDLSVKSQRAPPVCEHGTWAFAGPRHEARRG